ncbi:MAG: DUF1254 domain-containing protein [Mycobacteriaceae bacterium]|nr:DUF1254 domain-containing protein [Mycobacteriaceae bacterium]
MSPDNFVRAETDRNFGNAVNDGGFGKFHHNRELASADKQLVVRENRDTLYSAAVFDLEAAPVTVTLPDPGKRFMSLQVINEDEYVPEVVYAPGLREFTRDTVGTRYVMLAVRILANPNDEGDLATAHGLQDAIKVKQDHVGTFVLPKWDQASQGKVRTALLALATTLPDSRGMFGTKADTDPVRHLIGAASAWGGNPDKDALYLNVSPARSDGATVHRLTVGDVPVEAFWSVTVYNALGYFIPNPQNAYAVNSITATRGADGKVTVQFGGCDGTVPNCLPIIFGWNYTVRLYRPKQQILSGQWTFPQAQPV